MRFVDSIVVFLLASLLTSTISAERPPASWQRRPTPRPPYFSDDDSNFYWGSTSTASTASGGWRRPQQTTTSTSNGRGTVGGHSFYSGASASVATSQNRGQHSHHHQQPLNETAETFVPFVKAKYDTASRTWVCPQPSPEVAVDNGGGPPRAEALLESRSSLPPTQTVASQSMLSLSAAMVLDRNANDSNYKNVLTSLTGVNFTVPEPEIGATGTGRSMVDLFGFDTKATFRGEKKTRSRTGASKPPAAQPAFCQPELTSVPLSTSDDPNIFTFPSCTRVMRCGGCCSHKLLACQPVRTEMTNMTVFQTTYVGHRLEFVAEKVISVLKHTACTCGCKIRKSDCNARQIYMRNECRCACRDRNEMAACNLKPHDRFWDPTQCKCLCKHETECSTGLLFDHTTCSCSIRESDVRQPLIRKPRRN